MFSDLITQFAQIVNHIHHVMQMINESLHLIGILFYLFDKYKQFVF